MTDPVLPAQIGQVTDQIKELDHKRDQTKEPETGPVPLVETGQDTDPLLDQTGDKMTTTRIVIRSPIIILAVKSSPIIPLTLRQRTRESLGDAEKGH